MNEIIKETKYLIFQVTKEKPKTKVVSVINKFSQEEIATIEWYGAWRQYCFMPEPFFRTVWNNSCIHDVYNVIQELMGHDRLRRAENK